VYEVLGNVLDCGAEVVEGRLRPGTTGSCAVPEVETILGSAERFGSAADRGGSIFTAERRSKLAIVGAEEVLD
jgi:hypothetical protein